MRENRDSFEESTLERDDRKSLNVLRARPHQILTVSYRSGGAPAEDEALPPPVAERVVDPSERFADANGEAPRAEQVAKPRGLVRMRAEFTARQRPEHREHTACRSLHQEDLSTSLDQGERQTDQETRAQGAVCPGKSVQQDW